MNMYPHLDEYISCNGNFTAEIDSTDISISSSTSTHTIEIEDNSDWITLRTDFHLTIERSISWYSNVDKTRKQIETMTIDLIENGCKVKYIYKDKELVSTDYFIGKKKVMSRISSFKLFGKKKIVEKYYSF